MNAGFAFSGIYDAVNAATPTFCFIENICGSWHTVGDHVSDFGEICYPLSTIEYEYTGCVLALLMVLVFISQVHQLMG
jgi:hypothetical protein